MKITPLLFALIMSLNAHSSVNFKNPAILTDSVINLIGLELRGQDDTDFIDQIVNVATDFKQTGQMALPENYVLQKNNFMHDSQKLAWNVSDAASLELAQKLNKTPEQFLNPYYELNPGQEDAQGTVKNILTTVDLAVGAKKLALNSETDAQKIAELKAELEELEAAREELSTLVNQGVESLTNGFEELSVDLQELATQIEGQTDNKSVKQVIFLKETLFSEDSLENRLALIDNKHGIYSELSQIERDELKAKLKKQQKIQDGLGTMSDALVAAQDTVNLLNKIGVIDDAQTAGFAKGLAITGDALQIATGLASGNIFMTVSGVANLFSHIIGEEPQPDPDQIRHEQVMEALSALQQGQIQILKSLSLISKQINTQFEVVFSQLKEIREISKTSMELLVEGKLKGLRDCEQFLESRRFFSDENGFFDYKSFSTHFLANKQLYSTCVDFINDQIRGKGLNLLSVATNEEEAKSIEKQLKKPAGWIKGKIDRESFRVNDILEFLKVSVKPEYHKAILGAMVRPSLTFDEVNLKLKAIASDAKKRAYFENLFDENITLGELKKFYNPRLVKRIAGVSAELLDQRLLRSPITDSIYPLEDITSHSFSPLDFFGGNTDLAIENFLLPLNLSQRLVSRSVAQNVLYSGDVLTPLLTIFGLRGDLIPYVKKAKAYKPMLPEVTYRARYILGQNPIMFENAIRYILVVPYHEISDLQMFANVKDLLLDEVAQKAEPYFVRNNTHSKQFWGLYEQYFKPMTGENIEGAFQVSSGLSDMIRGYLNWHKVGTGPKPKSELINLALNAWVLAGTKMTKDPTKGTKDKQHVAARLPTVKELQQKRLIHAEDTYSLSHQGQQIQDQLIKVRAQLQMQTQLPLRRSFFLKGL